MKTKFKTKFVQIALLSLGSISLLFGILSYGTSTSLPITEHRIASDVREKANFQKVMIVIFENTNYSEALEQPFFSDFAKKGVLFTNFHAETHPSQPNYIALTSGSTQDVTSDSSVTLNVRNIADLLEEHGKTWKVYAESYPGNCFLESKSGTYVRKHTPLLSYANIQDNPERCKRIVNAAELQKDIENNTIPNYSLYIPDINNDGHNTGPEFASKWFSKVFEPLINDPRFMDDMLLIATFDESGIFGKKEVGHNPDSNSPNPSRDNSGDTYGSNHIYTAFFGNSLMAGSQNTGLHNHYSLLRMIEDQFNLGTLDANDKKAPPIEGIWLHSTP